MVEFLVAMMLRSAVWVIAVALALALAVAGAQAPTLVHLDVPTRADANASLAANGRNVAVVWGATDPAGPTDVYLAVSADGGRSFGAPVRVNDQEGTARINGEMAPRVVFVPRSGHSPAIDVLWVARDLATTIRIARSIDGGRTFGPSRELQGAGAAGGRGWGALASDDRGGVHALWLDHRGMAADRASAGEHHHGQESGAEAATDGFAMAQKSGLYYSNGTSARELTKGVCYCCKTALAAGTDGTLYAAWRQVYAGNMRDIAFTVSRDGGRTFTPPARVSEDRWQLNGCPEDGPALVVDAGGTAHVVWPTVVTQPPAHKALFYASTRDGRAFTARTRVSPTGRNIAHPQIALGPAGEMAVFWDEIVNSRRRVFVSRKDDEGFGAPEPLSDTTTAAYAVPVYADGGFVVAWTEGSGDDARIVVRRLPVE
jgi:hypothetical protein